MSDNARVHPCDDPPTLADAQALVSRAEGEAAASPSAPPRRGRRILKRLALALLATLILLAALAVVAYEFGSMEPPSAEMRARYETLRAAGQAPQVPRGGFHVPIPGCKCHSPDPVVQMQHESVPIRECSRCHGGRAQAADATAVR